MDGIRQTIYDCDGVLADWTEYLIKQLDCGLSLEDIYDFDIKKVLRELRSKQHVRRAGAIVSNRQFTLTQPVLPWAQRLVDLAHEAGDLLVLTAPWASDGWYDARIEWLKDNLQIHQENVMVGHRKFLVKADLFVDDKPKNIIEWAESFPNGRGVLLAWSYNKNHPTLPSNARRMTPDELIKDLEGGFKPW